MSSMLLPVYDWDVRLYLVWKILRDIKSDFFVLGSNVLIYKNQF